VIDRLCPGSDVRGQLVIRGNALARKGFVINKALQGRGFDNPAGNLQPVHQGRQVVGMVEVVGRDSGRGGRIG
jgi:hypothetical protein